MGFLSLSLSSFWCELLILFKIIFKVSWLLLLLFDTLSFLEIILEVGDNDVEELVKC
jgi:hypothetical protein